MTVDFCEVAVHYVLVVIDDYSRFPDIDIVHSTSPKAVIPKLDRIFASMVYPKWLSPIMGPPLMVESLHTLLSTFVA